MPKWSDIRALQFLDMYEKHECLWNPRIEAYKNKSARNDAFDSMLSELKIPDLTANDIKLKIKSIRTTYKRELSSVLKAESNKTKGSPNYVPKLFWFHRADSFLRSVSTNRVTCGSVVMNLKSEHNEQFSGSEATKYTIAAEQTQLTTVAKQPPEKKCKQETLQEMTMCLEDEDIEEEAVTVTETIEEHHLPIEEVKHQIQQPVQQQEPHHGEEGMREETISITHYRPSDTYETTAGNHQTYHQENATVGMVNRSSQEDDEYSLFCRSVEAQLRSIPDAYSRSVAKFKIQQVLFEAETGHYRKTTQYVTIHNPISNTQA